MRAYERLLKYAGIYTTSDESSAATPSAQREFDLARLLAEEMESLGVQNVWLGEDCYVYGEIPAAEGMEACPAIGFISHMDTASDFCGE